MVICCEANPAALRLTEAARAARGAAPTLRHLLKSKQIGVFLVKLFLVIGLGNNLTPVPFPKPNI
jgi:hypothetical protein